MALYSTGSLSYLTTLERTRATLILPFTSISPGAAMFGRRHVFCHLRFRSSCSTSSIVFSLILCCNALRIINLGHRLIVKEPHGDILRHDKQCREVCKHSINTVNIVPFKRQNVMILVHITMRFTPRDLVA